MDDAGLGVVGGAGWIVTFGRGAGGHRHADDGAGAVWLVTVQRNRLLKLGVQTGTTGDKEETEWLRFQPSFSKSGNWKAQKLNNCVTYRIMNSMSPEGFSIWFSFRFIGPSQRLSPSTKRPPSRSFSSKSGTPLKTSETSLGLLISMRGSLEHLSYFRMITTFLTMYPLRPLQPS